MTRRSRGLANRPGKPYPATFRSFQWTHPELNWDLRHARAASSPWTMSPRFPVDLMGVEPTTPTLQGSVAPNGMQARLTSAGFSVGRRQFPPLARRPPVRGPFGN